MRFKRNGLIMLLCAGMLVSSCRAPSTTKLKAQDQGQMLGCTIANDWWLFLGFGAGLSVPFMAVVALASVITTAFLQNTACADHGPRQATVNDISKMTKDFVADDLTRDQIGQLAGVASKIDAYRPSSFSTGDLRNWIAEVQDLEMQFDARQLKAVTMWTVAAQMRYMVMHELVRRDLEVGHYQAAFDDASSAYRALEGAKNHNDPGVEATKTYEKGDIGVMAKVASIRAQIAVEAAEDKLFPKNVTVSGGRNVEGYYCKKPLPLSAEEQAYVGRFNGRETEEWAVLKARMDLIKAGAVCSDSEFKLLPLVQAKVGQVQAVLTAKFIDDHRQIQQLLTTYKAAAADMHTAAVTAQDAMYKFPKSSDGESESTDSSSSDLGAADGTGT